MKIFERRRNIERATLFKVRYILLLEDAKKIVEREFKCNKSMQQWIARNDNDTTFGIVIVNTLALIDDIWEPFTTIGRKTVTLSDLENIVRNLREDWKTSENGF